MKNYFYTNQIAERIQKLLDNNLKPDTSRNIYIGDFSIFPEPETMSGYLPAIFIYPNKIENQFANESFKLLYSPYSFVICYLHSVNLEDDNIAVIKGILGAEEIANVLMCYRTLDGFMVDKSDTEAGGMVLHSAVTDINYDSAIYDVARNLEIPAFIASLEFNVGFRTFRS